MPRRDRGSDPIHVPCRSAVTHDFEHQRLLILILFVPERAAPMLDDARSCCGPVSHSARLLPSISSRCRVSLGPLLQPLLRRRPAERQPQGHTKSLVIVSLTNAETQLRNCQGVSPMPSFSAYSDCVLTTTSSATDEWGEADVSEVELYGDVVLRFVSFDAGDYRGPFLPGFQSCAAMEPSTVQR